ncbi:MAG: GNAT family N-acetyltransferase [Clostridiales Family XIII bacterium]|jgi:GNAT superfamily N-acetyltransferase|nr:GNAT family N-acetyltransferase [Clostridiales Family XIII bacterium]
MYGETMILMIEEMKDQYRELVSFFIEQGLEFDPSEKEGPVPDEILKCWGAFDEFENQMGACVLATRDDEYICNGIAVYPEFRGKNVGSMLLDFLLQEVANLGGKRVFLVARAPEFFIENGFVPVEEGEAPAFAECETDDSCHPQILKFDAFA